VLLLQSRRNSGLLGEANRLIREQDGSGRPVSILRLRKEIRGGMR
jgi:hypothetical protein